MCALHWVFPWVSVCWVIVCFSAGEDVLCMELNGGCCGLGSFVGVSLCWCLCHMWVGFHGLCVVFLCDVK